MLNNMYFPQKWKVKIGAIPKKDKDKSLPSSYRSISLLPNLGKIFEMVINNAINHFCIKNIIPDNQYGFRMHYSILYAINKLVSDIQWALNVNNCLEACLIDLEKAFDTVWLDCLIFKLKIKKFSPTLIKLIWNMINNRTFFIYHNNKNLQKHIKVIMDFNKAL